MEQDKLTKKQKHCWSLPYFEFFNQQLDFTKNVYNRKGDVCNIFTCQKRNFFVITIDLSIQFVAGLDGIKNKLEAPAPIDRNIYVMTKEERLENGIVDLPATLADALEEFKSNLRNLRFYLGQVSY
ncbi:hypothetical protein BLMD_10035 [Bacillus paralicheniformis]|nr:hypothetical protein BLMD_10035 [Bacillus paralicheniformis]